jgi:hypothetical protein
LWVALGCHPGVLTLILASTWALAYMQLGHQHMLKDLSWHLGNKHNDVGKVTWELASGEKDTRKDGYSTLCSDCGLCLITSSWRTAQYPPLTPTPACCSSSPSTLQQPWHCPCSPQAGNSLGPSLSLVPGAQKVGRALSPPSSSHRKGQGLVDSVLSVMFSTQLSRPSPPHSGSYSLEPSLHIHRTQICSPGSPAMN